MRFAALLLLIAGTVVPSLAFAQGALQKQSLLEYIRGRDDLETRERAEWEKAIKIRFGGAALDEDNKVNTQITVAKAILSAAIFMQIEPKKAAAAAFEGYRGALGFVPPPLAIHYQILVLEGRKPKASMAQLTFDFPKYYTDELAPEIVAYWERQLKSGEVPDYLLEETKEALAATRVKMRPLLADKLRLIARLEEDRQGAPSELRAQIDKDIGEVEAELERSFSGVASRPDVLDGSKSAADRLELLLQDIGVGPDEVAEEEARREEVRRQQAEVRRRAEEERRKKEAEAREEEERKAAEEIARRAEEERKRAQADRARAEEERKRAEESVRRAEEERRKAEEDVRRAEAAKREEAERRRQDADKRALEEKKRAEEAKRRALEEEKRETEAKRRVEAERRAAEEERKAREAERRADEERRHAEDEKRRAEEERKVQEARRRADEERRLRPREDDRKKDFERQTSGKKLFARTDVPPRLKDTISPWLGTPYLWGGTEKKKGTDCSGFTKGVNHEGFFVELPRVSRDQYRTGRAVDQKELQAGDLVFFDTKDVGNINHVGIYAGDGEFAHASSTRGVVYDKLEKKYFQKAYRGARRILAVK
jgi:cell wall-associated NlpC family hydrolase